MQFYVTGTHTYAQDSYDQPNGQYQITVTVTDTDGNVLTGTQYVSVVRPPMAEYTGAVETGPRQNSLSLTNVQVAAFTVPDSSDGSGEFSATINWGDNSTSAGTIQEVTPGLFEVVGSHTYSIYSLYTITVTVQQGWAAALNAAVDAAPAQAGAPADEITLTKIITATDTPQQMVAQKLYRIPPGYYNRLAGPAAAVSNLQPVKVTVGKAFANDKLIIEFVNNGGANGGAVFDDVKSIGVQRSLKVGVNNLNISGQTQTTATDTAKAPTEGKGGGNAGKIYLRVVDQTTGKVLAETEPFRAVSLRTP